MNSPATSTPSHAVQLLTRHLVEISGMVSLQERLPEIAGLLTERLADHSQKSPEVFVDELLQSGSPNEEIFFFLDRLTIGETYFFRHPEVFAALESSIFPDWTKSKQPIHAWSAACSNGSEAFSLAISWHEFLNARSLDGPELSILGTDLNRLCIEQARESHFGKWSLRNLSSECANRFFEEKAGRFYLRPKFLPNVQFRQFNLLDNPSSLGLTPDSLDLIFCRNVLIYFSPEVIRQLLEKFRIFLRPGGWLIPGASECAGEYFQGYEPVNFPGAVLYRKPAISSTESKYAFPLTQKNKENQTPNLVDSWVLKKERVAKNLPVSSAEPAHPAFDNSWQPPVLPPAPLLKKSTPAANPTAELSLEVIVPEFPPKSPLTLETQILQLLLVNEFKPDLHYVLALLKIIEGLDAEAETLLRRCLYLDRNHVGAQSELAFLLSRQQRFDAAKKALRVARKIIVSIPPQDKCLCHKGWISISGIDQLLQRLPIS